MVSYLNIPYEHWCFPFLLPSDPKCGQLWPTDRVPPSFSRAQANDPQRRVSAPCATLPPQNTRPLFIDSLPDPSSPPGVSAPSAASWPCHEPHTPNHPIQTSHPSPLPTPCLPPTPALKTEPDEQPVNFELGDTWLSTTNEISTAIPLRANYASKKMKQMMGVFRLDMFATTCPQGVSRKKARQPPPYPVGPLEEPSQMMVLDAETMEPLESRPVDANAQDFCAFDDDSLDEQLHQPPEDFESQIHSPCSSQPSCRSSPVSLSSHVESTISTDYFPDESIFAYQQPTMYPQGFVSDPQEIYGLTRAWASDPANVAHHHQVSPSIATPSPFPEQRDQGYHNLYPHHHHHPLQTPTRSAPPTPGGARQLDHPSSWAHPSYPLQQTLLDRSQ